MTTYTTWDIILGMRYAGFFDLITACCAVLLVILVLCKK